MDKIQISEILSKDLQEVIEFNSPRLVNVYHVTPSKGVKFCPAGDINGKGCPVKSKKHFEDYSEKEAREQARQKKWVPRPPGWKSKKLPEPVSQTETLNLLKNEINEKGFHFNSQYSCKCQVSMIKGIELFDFCCYLCGEKLFECRNNKYIELETKSVDHIVPQTLGGRTIAGNLLMSHSKCNGLKANIPIEEILLPGDFNNRLNNFRRLFCEEPIVWNETAKSFLEMLEERRNKNEANDAAAIANPLETIIENSNASSSATYEDLLEEPEEFDDDFYGELDEEFDLNTLETNVNNADTVKYDNEASLDELLLNGLQNNISESDILLKLLFNATSEINQQDVSSLNVNSRKTTLKKEIELLKNVLEHKIKELGYLEFIS